MVRAVCEDGELRKMLAMLLDSDFERTLRLPSVRAATVYTMSAPAAYSVHAATLFLAGETIFRRAHW